MKKKRDIFRWSQSDSFNNLKKKTVGALGTRMLLALLKSALELPSLESSACAK